MTTFYLGRTKDGQPVTRMSTRSDFTYAAVPVGWKAAGGRLPSFSTTAQGAIRNFDSSGRGTSPELVPVDKVDAAAYRAAKAETAKRGA